MALIKLTSKRQATLPRRMCDELGVHAGDRIDVSRQLVNGKVVWCLVPDRSIPPLWYGKFRKFASGKSHEMRDIRISVERARKND